MLGIKYKLNFTKKFKTVISNIYQQSIISSVYGEQKKKI